jgi:hypothetical protein
MHPLGFQPKKLAGERPPRVCTVNGERNSCVMRWVSVETVSSSVVVVVVVLVVVVLVVVVVVVVW